MVKFIGRYLERWTERLPLQLRVLHRQFLLRVVDLEALSIEADIPAYLGQFAGILIMISLCHAFGLMFFPPPFAEPRGYEQARLADMQLDIGICSRIIFFFVVVVF